MIGQRSTVGRRRKAGLLQLLAFAVICSITDAFTSLPLHRSISFCQRLYEQSSHNELEGDFPLDDEDEANYRPGFFGAASSRAKEVAQNGRDRLQTTAENSKNGVANRVKQAVQSVGGLSPNLPSRGREDVASAAGAAWSGVSKVVSTGRRGVSSATQMATSGLGSARTGLSSLSQSGLSKASDIALWMDAQAKQGTSVVNSKARDWVLKFTGKPEYHFGDIAKEVLRRASSVDYNLRDILLLLKVLLTLGATITPLAKILPITVLLEMLNTSIESRLGGKLLQVLAEALDERFVAAFSAEELGDLAKRSLTGAIVAFTGKTSYQKGDIEETVANMNQSNGNDNVAEQGFVATSVATTEPVTQSMPSSPRTLDLQIGPEFADWDQAFRESHPEWDVELAVEASLDTGDIGGLSSPATQRKLEALDLEFVSELEDWDRKFDRLYSNNHESPY